MNKDPDINRIRQVAIIQTTAPNSHVVQCGYCGGTGRKPLRTDAECQVTDWSTLTCELCKGKGVLRIECQDIPVYHAYCRGTGRSASDSFPVSRCSECRGVGIQSLTGTLKVLN